jgi:hypothetical protein
MKTSNKILLISSLSALGIFGAVHLALYAKYARGDFSSGSPDEKMTTLFAGPAPAVLYLEGSLNVRFLPSDSFSVECAKADEDRINMRQSGDSFHVIGDTNITRNPHTSWQQFDYFPWVTVHCGRSKKIQLSGVIALIKGTSSAGSFALELGITNTQLVMGEPDDNAPGIHKLALGAQTGRKLEFYDKLDIRSVNSNVVMNANSVIRDLDIQLDDRSEMHDFDAQIDSPLISYSAHSQIDLSGANFKKLK